MIPVNLQLPDDVILSVLLLLDAKDVRSFGNTCRRFRKLMIINKSKLRVPKLQWNTARLEFGHRIILSRSIAPACKRQQTLMANDSWEFTKSEFLKYFVNLFIVISPNFMYIKCKHLDENIARIARKCVGGLWGRILALEMDKCSLGEDDLRRFFEHFSPFSLHLTGHFDRSIISDQVLPLSTLFSLFVGANRSELRTRTKISGITVRKIVNNWFQRYSNNPGMKSVKNYETLMCAIEIPDCDLDYNEFFALFKELTLVPSVTSKRIRIHNLPQTLIDAVYRNVPTLFDSLGLTSWVQQGLCTDDDVNCSYTVFFKSNSKSSHLARRTFTDVGSLSEVRDVVGLNLSATIYAFDDELLRWKRLVDVSFALFSTPQSAEMSIPEERLTGSQKKLMASRKLWTWSVVCSIFSYCEIDDFSIKIT